MNACVRRLLFRPATRRQEFGPRRGRRWRPLASDAAEGRSPSLAFHCAIFNFDVIAARLLASPAAGQIY
jgi:hypothetical protein